MMAAGWNKGKKWSDEVKRRISEGTTKNHPLRGPNRERMIERLSRWRNEGVHRPDCGCSHCSIETRLKISENNKGKNKRKLKYRI